MIRKCIDLTKFICTDRFRLIIHFNFHNFIKIAAEGSGKIIYGLARSLVYVVLTLFVKLNHAKGNAA